MLSGIDWTPFISYIQNHYPAAMPYLHAIFFLIPIVGGVCYALRNILPEPGVEHPIVDDTELKGRLGAGFYNWIHHWVGIYNQLLVVLNWINKTGLYAMFYHLILLCAADFGSRKPVSDDGTSKLITMPKQYVPAPTKPPADDKKGS